VGEHDAFCSLPLPVPRLTGHQRVNLKRSNKLGDMLRSVYLVPWNIEFREEDMASSTEDNHSPKTSSKRYKMLDLHNALDLDGFSRMT
jgi:hypothetical protein